MSKRQEMREKRRREKMRNQIFIILFIVAGALLVVFTLIWPMIQSEHESTATATAAASSPVIVATPQVHVAVADGVHLGDPNAPVKVDVYEDFRCSACAYYTTNIEPLIIQNYVDTGMVYYTFHSYIVIDNYDNTTTSYNSSLAAMCAADQNMFWEYHDTLYANQVTEAAELFSDDRLVQMAQNVGLEMDSFTQCFENKQHESIIQSDIAAYEELVANQTDTTRFTPSIFVNGVRIQTSLDSLSTAIETAAGQ